MEAGGDIPSDEFSIRKDEISVRIKKIIIRNAEFYLRIKKFLIRNPEFHLRIKKTFIPPTPIVIL